MQCSLAITRFHVLTLPGINPGGSWFREPTCHGTLAGTVVEVVSPQAFASVARRPLPCAPRYGRDRDGTATRACADREVGTAPPPKLAESYAARVLRSLTSSRSCFYPKERFPLEPPKHDEIVKCATALFFLRRAKPERGGGAGAHHQLGSSPNWSSQPPQACKRLFIPGMNHRGFPAKFSVM
jgi:hypothetical protein